MSIQSEIERIEANIAAAYAKCATKGGTDLSGSKSDRLVDAIESIPSGMTTIDFSAGVIDHLYPDSISNGTVFSIASSKFQFKLNFVKSSDILIGSILWKPSTTNGTILVRSFWGLSGVTKDVVLDGVGQPGLVTMSLAPDRGKVVVTIPFDATISASNPYAVTNLTFFRQ